MPDFARGAADLAHQADRGDNAVPKQPEPPTADSAAQSRAARTALDGNRAAAAHAVQAIGPHVPRYDARDKVTGRTPYADDVPAAGCAYAYAVTSPVARGRIRGVDAAAARAVPGVLRVYTHASMAGRLAPARFVSQGGQAATDLAVMGGPEVVHAGQIIGLVVAESFEAAREAAYAVRYDIAAEAPAGTFGDAGVRTRPLAEVDPNWRDPAAGDADAAVAASVHMVEAEYTTPTQHQNPIELFSTTCWWEGDRLVVHEPSGAVAPTRIGLAAQLGIPPECVDVISPFVGGSFGSKNSLTPRTALVAVAARDLGRPVRCVLTRAQGFTQATYRAETRHRVRLACDGEGRLTSYGHEAWELTSRTDVYAVHGTSVTAHMYAWPHLATRVHVAEGDRSTPGFMRAPAEMPYMFALECAVDELAERAGVDPVRFRQMNDVRVSAHQGKRFTSRALNACLAQGAAAFGWAARDPRPGAMRDGDWQVGYGVASACYPTKFSPCAARVRVHADGRVDVEVGAHEIGNGAYGAAAIVAAQELGVPVGHVRVALGDSRLPPGPIAGSSRITATMGNAVAAACHQLRVQLGVPDGAPVTAALAAVAAAGGAAEAHVDWTYPGAAPNAVAEFYRGASLPKGGAEGDVLRYAFGAEFVEVRVHRRTREVRVPRVVGAFAAGRIVNATTARSQMVGGMIWGVGSALHEATELDRRAARYVNDNVGEYLVPVNADVPAVEVLLLPEDDRDVNALGIKGVGELGNVGTAAAVCNAVYHATGTRVRDLPIRIDQLIA